MNQMKPPLTRAGARMMSQPSPWRSRQHYQMVRINKRGEVSLPAQSGRNEDPCYVPSWLPPSGPCSHRTLYGKPSLTPPPHTNPQLLGLPCGLQPSPLPNAAPPNSSHFHLSVCLSSPSPLRPLRECHEGDDFVSFVY